MVVLRLYLGFLTLESAALVLEGSEHLREVSEPITSFDEGDSLHALEIFGCVFFEALLSVLSISSREDLDSAELFVLGDKCLQFASQSLFFLHVSFALGRSLEVRGSGESGDDFLKDLALDLELIFNNLALRIKLQQLAL